MKYLALAAFSLVSLAARSAAAMTPEACADAAYEGQKLRDGGSFLRAKAAFAACTDVSCPAPIRTDCAAFFEETSRRTPTFVVRVVADDGMDTTNFAVTLDGAPIKLDGRALSLDPGPHAFSAKALDGRVQTVTVTASEGDQGRPVTLTFPRIVREVAVPVQAPRSPTRTPSYVLFGVGATALAAFGVFGTWGLVQRSSLQDCRPSCATSDVDAARVKLVVADISLATSLVTTAVGLVLWFAGDSSKVSSSSAQLDLPHGWRF